MILSNPSDTTSFMYSESSVHDKRRLRMPFNRMRCLWIARYIPYPLDEGAKVYSANLAQSLADSGVFVRFMGFGNTAEVPESAASVEWLPVPGRRRNKMISVCSRWPVAAAVDATKAFASLLDRQLQEPWDVLVLDGYGTGWALERCMSHRKAARGHAPILVHVSHNHEEILWDAMARDARGSAPRRWMLRQNAGKVRSLERRIVRNVDMLTTITDEDRHSLGAGMRDDRLFSLTPGYTGWTAHERSITAATPRRVIIMGSFRWIVKQENLARFVEMADPIFQQQGIGLDIVGEVPPALLSSLQARCQATRFHGFLTEAAPLFANARIGVVPEAIGGGFKLKFLDYIFGRLPVATFRQAAAGLPSELQRTMLLSDSLAGLIREITSHIDRIDDLNRMQEQAFALGKAHYKWSARGEQFREAIAAMRQQSTCEPINA
jgi:hypothetical protein